MTIKKDCMLLWDKEQEAIKKNPFITQEELSQIIGLTRKSIVQNMKKLQENGLLKRVGADKNGHWEYHH